MHRLMILQTLHKLKNLKFKIDSNLVDLYYFIREYFYPALTPSEAYVFQSFRQNHLKINPSFVPKTRGSLSIFWVGASYSQDHSGFVQALQSFGNVDYYRYDHKQYGPLNLSKCSHKNVTISYIREYNDRMLFEQVLSSHRKQPIDFLIGQMWGHLYSPQVFKKIRDLGIPVLNISMDDMLPYSWIISKSFRMGSIGLSPYIDLVLCSTASRLSRYYLHNVNACYFPMASSPMVFYPQPQILKDIDILFIGNAYGIRFKIVSSLRRAGFSVVCFGNGWSNGYADVDLSRKLYSRSKIILGIGTIANADDTYTLKLRDFDAPMSGSFYITHRHPPLQSLFTEGQHVEYYGDIDELIYKLRFYLDNDESRQKIATNAHLHASKFHTWDLRLQNLFMSTGLLAS